MVAASFPLFSRQMFQGMGIQWASTLLGCVAAVLVPIPIGFYFFGKRLRMKSKFAPFYEAVQEGHGTDNLDAQAEETIRRPSH
jgi:DHA1 family multidrug resistance protein-like MFS transporter